MEEAQSGQIGQAVGQRIQVGTDERQLVLDRRVPWQVRSIPRACFRDERIESCLGGLRQVRSWTVKASRTA